jgi:hypothetical protein
MDGVTDMVKVSSVVSLFCLIVFVFSRMASVAFE